jgi:transposase
MTEDNIEFYYESGIAGVPSSLQLPVILEDEKRLLRITSIFDYHDPSSEALINNSSETNENTTTDEKIENNDNKNVKNKRGPYRNYTDAQLAQLIFLKTERNMSTAAAARSAGIIKSTAYSMIARYEKDLEKKLPTKNYPARMGPEPSFTDQHTNHIVDYLEEHPTAVVDDVVANLCTKFDNLKVSKTSVHRHIKEKCCFTLKRAEKRTFSRNNEVTVEKRANWVAKWINSDMDFLKNCIFIDEAGFYLDMVRNLAWSKKGEPVPVQVSSIRGTSITIFGAICSEGIVDLTLRKPRVMKKRKLASGKISMARVAEGTKAEDYLEFIDGVIEILNEKNYTGYYFVMDNAPIHPAQIVEEKLKAAGHYSVFLSPYSPFLNPIEEFWSKLKASIKRDQLVEGNLLSDRIREASKTVTLKDLHGWITHSVSYFVRCDNKETNL